MPSTADWFAKRLGTAPPQQAPGPTPHQQPVYRQQPAAPAQPQQPVDPNNVKPGDPGSFSHALEQGQTRGGDAVKASATGDCPECGSGNYIKIKKTGSFRCYDCGYPVVQDFSPGGIGTAEAQAKGML